MTKLVLFGDGGVGKTSWINKILMNEWDAKYIPTIGCEVHPFYLNGKWFNIWDVAGQEKYNLDYNKMLENADVVFIFYDDSKTSYKNVEFWKNKVGDIPIRLVRSKCDIPNNNKGNPGIPVSAKNNINVLGPFKSL